MVFKGDNCFNVGIKINSNMSYKAKCFTLFQFAMPGLVTQSRLLQLEVNLKEYEHDNFS